MEQFISGLVYERHCSSPRINFIHDVPGVGAGMRVPVRWFLWNCCRPKRLQRNDHCAWFAAKTWCFLAMPRQLVSICLFAVDLPKELSTSAKTDARDKDVRFWSRCIMLIVCPSLKTSCLLHPQDGIRPPRPAAAFCAKVYLHHQTAGSLGCVAPCTFARRAKHMLQPAARTHVLLIHDRSWMPTCLAVAQTRTWHSRQKRCLRLLGVWGAVLLWYFS